MRADPPRWIRTPRVPDPHLTTLLALLLASVPAVAGDGAGIAGLVSTDDGTFEDGVFWPPSDGWSPDDGTFAQRLPVVGSITAVTVRVWHPEPPDGVSGPWTAEITVREDAGDRPGKAIALGTVLLADEIAVRPAWTTITVPLEAGDVRFPWCGVRLTGPEGATPVAVLADLDGPGYLPPMTHVPPGLGFPEGWHELGVAFPPATSLAIGAEMVDIAHVGPTLEWLGGTELGGVARTGEWTFDRLDDGEEAPAEACTYAMGEVVGPLLDDEGWHPTADSDPIVGVVRLDDDPALVAACDPTGVAGGALTFEDPDLGGFPPGHRGLVASPPLDEAALGIDPGPSSLEFEACPGPDVPPDVGLLRWVVGSRLQYGDGTWSDWKDLTFPVSPDPETYRVPLLHEGPVTQVRIGIENPSGVLIDVRPKADLVSKKKKKDDAEPPPEIWKPVPKLKQNRQRPCMVAAAASCLAYWAQTYPEIMPAGQDTAARHEALMDSLAHYMCEKKRGTHGIIDYLKAKKVYKGQDVAGGKDPLEFESKKGSKATHDHAKTELEACHDVLLGLKGYTTDEDGNPVALNRDGKEIAHMVTAAQFVEKNGKKTVKAANSHGKAVDEVTDENKDETYDSFEVETAGDEQMKLRHADLEKKWKVEYFCVTEVIVIKPVPDDDEERWRPPVTAREARSGDLVTYAYDVTNLEDDPLSFVALPLEVPVIEVTAPPGWTWASLPALPPGGRSCEVEVGPEGIVWTTDTDPISPGETRGGFSFVTDAGYASSPVAIPASLATDGLVERVSLVPGPLPGGVLGAPGGAPAPGRPSLVVTPTPARSAVTLHARLGVDGPARLSLFDASGRLVREVTVPHVDGGEHRFQWDGRDTRGHRVAPGVYFGIVDANGRTVRARVVFAGNGGGGW